MNAPSSLQTRTHRTSPRFPECIQTMADKPDVEKTYKMGAPVLRSTTTQSDAWPETGNSTANVSEHSRDLNDPALATDVNMGSEWS